jgi:hypothetical protein
MSHAAGIVDWVASSPIIDGVLFGSSDWEVEGPPVCAVAVARGFRGFGKGVTQSDALASAVGEALEQYAASQVRPLELYGATFREIEEQPSTRFLRLRQQVALGDDRWVVGVLAGWLG